MGLLQTSGDADFYKKVDVTDALSFIVDDEGKVQHSSSKDYDFETGSSGKLEYNKNGKGAAKYSIVTE